MDEELIPSGEPQEGAPQEPQPEPQPEPPSDILVRYRGEEVPVPAELIHGLAGVFKTTPERTVSWVQMQMDANRAWNEAERYKQRAESLEADWQRHLSMQGQRQTPAPQYGGNGYTAPPSYAPPSYPQPNGYSQQSPPQYQPQQGAMDDPIALMQMTRQELVQMREDMRRREERWEEQNRDDAVRQDQARWDTAADRFLAEKNQGRKKPITKEELLGEVRFSGMYLSPLPPERIFDKAWRVMTYEDAGTTAQADLMTRLRAPTAKVTIPGAPSNQPPPASQKPKEPDFGNITMRDVVENLPITRNL